MLLRLHKDAGNRTPALILADNGSDEVLAIVGANLNEEQ
jgi:hypothetical protein